MSRLWLSVGKKEEAYRQLAGLNAWFAEGIETKDLMEAKALLEEFAAG